MIFTTKDSLEKSRLVGGRYVPWVNNKVIKIRGISMWQVEAYDEMVEVLVALTPRLRTMEGLEKMSFGLCNCRSSREENGEYSIQGDVVAYIP